jgi:hypothetical protein
MVSVSRARSCGWRRSILPAVVVLVAVGVWASSAAAAGRWSV